MIWAESWCDVGNFVVAAIVCFSGVVGGVFAYRRWRHECRLERANRLKDILAAFDSTKICELVNRLDSEGGHSEWFSKLTDESEAEVMRSFRFLSYVCYLHEKNLISDEEFVLFEGQIKAVLRDEDVQTYLTDTPIEIDGDAAKGQFAYLIRYAQSIGAYPIRRHPTDIDPPNNLRPQVNSTHKPDVPIDECFDKETCEVRKKKRIARGVGAITDIIEAAKQQESSTLSFRGFYLGMTVEAAHRLLVHYDGNRKYSEKNNGLQDAEYADNIFAFDYPCALVVKAENGIVTEFVFSRRLIDLIFGAEGKSAEQFVDELAKAYPILDKMMTKNVMVPDWPRRNALRDLVMKMQGPVESNGPIAGVEAALKFTNAQLTLAGMEKPGICYYQVSDKGFTLEITPNDGTPGEQVRFFVLKKKNK